MLLGIPFVVSQLNDLDIFCIDLQNAYLNDIPRKKVFLKTGPDFGNLVGRYVIIARALYGFEPSCAAFRVKSADDLRNFGYKNTTADGDVYMKERTIENGFYYFEYIIVYVDDSNLNQ